MKNFTLISLLLGGFFAYSQNAIVQISDNILKMEQALIGKDSLVLQKILHADLSFGHSNAYIETKQELLDDMKTDKIVYTRFEKKNDIIFTFLSDNTIVSRREIQAIGTFKQHDFDLDMNVLEIWILEHNEWKLLARQGVKMKQ